MAIALFLGQAVGGSRILGLVEQDDRSVTAQHAFDGALPAAVRHFDDVRQHRVADARVAQCAAHAAHIVRLRHGRLALQRGNRRLLARDARRQGVALLALLQQLRFLLFQLGRHFGDVAARVGCQLVQTVLLFQQAVQRFELAIDQGQAALQADRFLLQQGFVHLRVGQGLRLRRQRIAFIGQLLVRLRHRFARIAQLAGGLSRLFARLVVLQAGQHFFQQVAALFMQPFPLVVIGYAQAQAFQVGLRRFQFRLEAFQLHFRIALVALGFVVGVQHFLVAEHLEYQVEQLARRVFAQFVRLALLQCQHFRHGGRQASIGQALAVVFHTEPIVGVRDVLDLHIAWTHQILALPVAAILLDLAKQRHFIVAEEAGAAERAVRQLLAHVLVVDHGAQPGRLLARVARIVFIRAAHRAIEAEQGAQGVEQGGLARAVLPRDGDDLRVERNVLDALPVIPVHQFK